MNKTIPFWHLPDGGTLSAVGTSHNVTDGYAFYDGSPPAPVIYTGSVTVTGVGGTPPYTYAWTDVTPASGIHIHFPTSATTNFYEQSATGPYVKIGQFLCTVTDAVAATSTWSVDDVTIEQTT